MSRFMNKIRQMAEQTNVPAHPLVDKLNANQSARASYWLTFVLYAKVEEKDLETKLLELGKSLKLDDTALQEELSAVKMCSSDEDFESLVKECTSGVADSIAKILLFVELNQFRKRNKMSLDFLPDMMSIMKLTDSAKDFVNEFNTIVNSTKPNLLKFYNVTKKFPNIPVFVYESFASDLWAECSKDLSKEASGLVKIITKNFSEEFWQDLLFDLKDNDADRFNPAQYSIIDRNILSRGKCVPFADLKQFYSSMGRNYRAVNFYADQEAVEKKYKEIEDSFAKKNHDVLLPMVKRYVFQQYYNKLQTFFSEVRKRIANADGIDGTRNDPAFDDEDGIREILALRYYLRFSAGLTEQYVDDGCCFWRIDECFWNKYEEIETAEARQAALKELDSIIAVYEEENKKLSPFFG